MAYLFLWVLFYLLLFFVVSWAHPIPWFLKIKNEFLSSSQHISDVTSCV